MSEPVNERPEDATLEQLLRESGGRAVPPDELMREVRDAVHREWRDVVKERGRRRRVQTLAAAASLAGLALVAGTTVVWDSAPAQVVAQAGRIEGSVTRDAGLLRPERALNANGAIYVGDEVSTAQDGRAAFTVSDGFSLRLDASSKIKLVSANRIQLQRGAVYIDASPSADKATNFIVDTHVGSVRHLGTQYEVRSTREGIQVSVREGRVVIDNNGALYAGEAGEQIALSEAGVIGRSTLPPSDSHWAWVHQIAPSFDIDNRSLADFLEWLGRETGYSIEYASADAKNEAQATRLRGSIEGLAPEAALAAVLSTTNLESVESNHNNILIDARTGR